MNDLPARGPARRLVSGQARETQLDGVDGRTLFPSPDFTYWPPFERFAEAVGMAVEAPDLHAHRREEVVMYVLSGRLGEHDEGQPVSEIPAGSVRLLATGPETVHDTSPATGGRTHWVSLVIRRLDDVRDPTPARQSSPVVPWAAAPPGLAGSAVVGPGSSVRSPSGLRLFDVRFPDVREAELPVGPAADALVYVLEGRAQVEGRELAAGAGLLSSGWETLRTRGAGGTRLIFAAVPRAGSQDGR